ncbi:CAP domain-containing protein [Sphingomonas radiodurans]|uniref:CAP domain-containing protein n=1 Tax=Sphingomonas radiodurans TaxID=2890321 RepID=UPI001E4AD171|nr:CAP domain-containing protein [Sphingomonas radiodurans]WBH16240.1 CAP domain-containing protein [Sphingomonas radiodurans]
MAAMIARRHLIALSLLLAGCAPGVERGPERPPDRVVEQRVNELPARRSEALLRRTMLTAHDRARADVGLPPLVWDEALVTTALGYAREMARTGRFEHAAQPHGPTREGENLWTGTRNAYAYDEMIGYWVAEKRDFVNGATPMFSRTGRWQDVAHYTQIVWRRTTRVGCAFASNARDDFSSAATAQAATW